MRIQMGLRTVAVFIDFIAFCVLERFGGLRNRHFHCILFDLASLGGGIRTRIELRTFVVFIDFMTFCFIRQALEAEYKHE